MGPTEYLRIRSVGWSPNESVNLSGCDRHHLSWTRRRRTTNGHPSTTYIRMDWRNSCKSSTRLLNLLSMTTRTLQAIECAPTPNSWMNIRLHADNNVRILAMVIFRVSMKHNQCIFSDWIHKDSTQLNPAANQRKCRLHTIPREADISTGPFENEFNLTCFNWKSLLLMTPMFILFLFEINAFRSTHTPTNYCLLSTL